MTVWVCVVRHQAFAGGESQRCRHIFNDSKCQEMELIGGEPIEWCVTHDSPKAAKWVCQEVLSHLDKPDDGTRCQFESQIRVGP